MLDAIKRWLRGHNQKPLQPLERETEELARRLDAVYQTMASGDLTRALQRCTVVTDFLNGLAAGEPGADARKLLALGYFDLASAYREMARVPEAETAYAEAVKWLESLQGVPEHTRFAGTQLAACKNHLGLLYMECGPAEKAVAALEEAISRRRVLAQQQPEDGENRIHLGGALCNRAHVARDHGDTAAAKSLYDESIAVIEEAIPPCNCGCRDAIASAFSNRLGHPHWILLGHHFRRNAEEGRALLTEQRPG